MPRRSSKTPGAAETGSAGAVPSLTSGGSADQVAGGPAEPSTEQNPVEERSADQEREFDILELLSRRPPMLITAGLLMVGYAVLIAAAVLGNPIVFGSALIFCTAVDVVIELYSRPLVAVLRQAQFGISHRVFVQTFMLLLLVAVTNGVRGSDRVQLTLITFVSIGIPLARVFYLGMLTLIRRRRSRVVAVRNLEVPALEDPPLPKILTKNPGTRLLVIGVLPVLAGAISVEFSTFLPFFITSGAYILMVAVAALALLVVLVRHRHEPEPEELLAEVAERLAERRPEVMLYFSGSAKSTYQADMWLETLEKTNRSVVIVVRERHLINGLAPTTLPVVCIPDQVALMTFPLPDVRVALYAANVGKNIHFLREPRVKHVFIGHGDSDKVASFNPFSKAYDEVWVAGQGGRDRYAKARVGVRDECIVEVGRPQLDVLDRGWSYDPERPLTVLYAPTWEGWNDDDFQTSVTDMGPEIVRQLLAGPAPVRVIYKPHPLTGTRDPRAGEAHEAMKSMLEDANRRNGRIDAREWSRLRELDAELDDPELEPHEVAELTARWSELYWRLQEGRHVVAVGQRRPTLFECFNASDVLVSDISSVPADFIATGKPYVVTNPQDAPEAEFREEFPSTGAAYLLGPECAELGDIMAAISGTDPRREDREVLREYLLGSDTPPSLDRWNDAVDSLVERAIAEWADDHGAGPVDHEVLHDRSDDSEVADDPVDSEIADDSLDSEVRDDSEDPDEPAGHRSAGATGGGTGEQPADVTPRVAR